MPNRFLFDSVYNIDGNLGSGALGIGTYHSADLLGNAALAAGLGFTAALFTEGLHQGRKNFTFFVLAACCFLFLPGGRPQMIAGAAALCLLVGLLLRRKRKETADETLETM